MVEPTIPEMLRVGLKAVQEYWEKPEERFRVNWPDDLEGQGLCITQLGNFARSPEVPWNVRVWAFDTLQAAAAQYSTNNNPSAIPTQMHTWALWVSSGAVERPKRPRGRDRDKNLGRDRVVACLIAWLRQYQGYTYEAAIELVAESTGLTVEAVKSILKKERDSGRPSPLETVKKALSRQSMPV